MPSEYYIDIIPALIVLGITLVVVGGIKLFCMILEWDDRTYMEEFERTMAEHKDQK